MKIVDFDTFINMPEGTVYCVYQPYHFDKISIKGKSINDLDWFYSEIQDSFCEKDVNEFTQFDEQCEQMEAGKELKADYKLQMRDGLFDASRQFLIYNNEDLKELVKFISTLIK